MGMEWATPRRVYHPHRVNRQTLQLQSADWCKGTIHDMPSISHSVRVHVCPSSLVERRPKTKVFDHLAPTVVDQQEEPGHADAPYLQSEGLGRHLYRAVCVHGVWLGNQGNHPDISIYCLAAKTVWSKCFDTQNIADQNSSSLSCHFPSQPGRSVGRAIYLSSSMLSSALGPWTLWAHLDRWDDGVMWVMWVWIPPCTSLNPSKLQNRLCWAKERPKTLACSANVRDARGVWEGHSKQCVLCIFVEFGWIG